MKKEKRFSNARAIVFFVIAIIVTILALILAINVFHLFKDNLIEGPMDFISWLIPLGIALVMWLLFFGEITKIKASDEELEQWKNQILDKHPNATNYVTQEDMKKFTTKISFWLHTLRNGIAKISAAVALPVALVGFVAAIAIPFVGIFSEGGGFSYGIYISDCGSCAVATAYNFKSDKTYQMGMCDKGAGYSYTWTKSGTYTLNGSKITISAGTFTAISATKLKDNTGGYWVKR